MLDQVTNALASRFIVERELGRGGMATVYLARDRKLDRRVAIKVLHADLAASVGADRFLREITLTARLNHPHILPLLDSGEADGLLYYAMPYVEGESLRDRLRREKQLSIKDALHIAAEVADALDHAHRHGIVHRDIKPDNVLLEDGHAVVADFGIARALSTSAGDNLTGTGVTVGTPEYMSPEQAGGDAILDGRSDIYAVGCLLYEMLAGQPPFMGVSAESVVRQHLAAEPRPVNAVRAAVPETVVAALQRTLAKSPADRFSSAHELRDALVRLAHGDTAHPTRRRLSPRRRILAGLILTVAIVGVAALLPGRTARRPTLAVLPFTLGRSSDARYANFADALHQALIYRLGMIPNVRTTERTSVLRYRGDTATPFRDIAKTLRVDFLASGSIERSAERVIVNVRLIDARTGKELFRQAYDERPSVAKLSEIQADIAQRVADALEVRIAATVRGRISGRPTESEAAYAFLLLASTLRVGSDTSQNQFAERLLLDAVKQDSGSPSVLATLGYVYAWRAYTLGGSRSLADSALHLAARALSTDSTVIAGYHALGFAHLALGHLDSAKSAFDRVLALRPSDGQALLFRGWLLFLRGDIDEAVQAWSDTKDVDPMNPTVLGDMSLVEMVLGDIGRARQWQNERRALGKSDNYANVGLARLELLDGRPDEAMREAERQLSNNPHSYQARAMAATAAMEAGRFAAARTHFEAMNRTASESWDFWGTTPRTSYAYVLARLGDSARSRVVLDSTLRQAMRLINQEGDQRPGVRREIAAIYAAYGRRDSAHTWLKEAIARGWRHEALQPSPWIMENSKDAEVKELLRGMQVEIDKMRNRIRREKLGPTLSQP